MIRALDLWLPSYLKQQRRPPGLGGGTRHILLSVCDHFEPLHRAGKTRALERVARWRRDFPPLAAQFRDADEQPPKQTFFYPIEQYDGDIVEAIADVCRASACEVEVHLHHNNDTAAALEEKLEEGKSNLLRHGLLSEDEDARVRFGFVHGNWALDDSHPRGRHCGVRTELTVLRQAGCYADFTMPSAPDRTQTRTINSLYYATDTPAPKSHDTGDPVFVRSGHRAPTPGSQHPGEERLLMIQGPLGLNWERRKFGLLPRIENGDLTRANPPTMARLRVWLRMNIHVLRRPEWLFVKLHTHGGIERNFEMLLGEAMRRFHRDLAGFTANGSGFRLHYVTAREMVNILHAAEDGHSGNPGKFRDYRFKSRIRQTS